MMFKEEQRFTSLWIWIPLAFVSLFTLGMLIMQIGWGIVLGNKPISDVGLIFISLIPLILCLYFYKVRMYTSLDAEGITVRYFPLSPFVLRWSEFKTVNLITYDFVGYGLRQSVKYGTVYNIRGNKGLLIETSKEKFLIGTSRPDEIIKAVEVYWKNHSVDFSGVRVKD